MVLTRSRKLQTSRLYVGTSVPCEKCYTTYCPDFLPLIASARLLLDVTQVVTSRQQTLECDRCKIWVHRLCGTGITQDEYRQMMKRSRKGEDVQWMCSECVASVPSSIGVPVMESTRIEAARTRAE